MEATIYYSPKTEQTLSVKPVGGQKHDNKYNGLFIAETPNGSTVYTKEELTAILLLNGFELVGTV